ncbi:AEC family transporter [Geomesophilobacter sediminis]|uniref:AEC family transporter n=1 Tax=Geomesophilobacter sediminis TaxID=2798584 RepID=A0A8J7IRH9_9BACT|nr:AEC family transporter [Geomesophilobacter sediminis]MBJ6725509.1 AEC family transporter [Geomesophilobacter sediminis]
MENFVIIGAFVLLGMLFRRLKGFPRETPQVLNMFALYVSLPALVLLKAPQIVFSRAAILPVIVPWGMLLLSVALLLLGGRLFRWPRHILGVLLLVVPVGNTSFLGIPMVQAFFGPAGLPHLIVYDQIGTMTIFSSYGSYILATYGKESRTDFAAIARKMLLFPPTVALIAGLALRSFPYPEKLALALHNLSLSLVPLVMTAVGFQLRLRLPRPVLGPLGYGLAVKLVVAPLLALAICRLLGEQGLAVEVSVLEAGMPPMVTAAALAVIAGMDAELSAALVSVGILLCFGTLPLLYYALQLTR